MTAEVVICVPMITPNKTKQTNNKSNASHRQTDRQVHMRTYTKHGKGMCLLDEDDASRQTLIDFCHNN